MLNNINIYYVFFYRCTSLPGHKDLNNSHGNHFITSNLSSEPEIVCTEEMLREAWKKLGVGDDGYLNQTELVLVCDAIGTFIF